MSGASLTPPRPGAPLRLAIVTPRFWPLLGDGPAHLLRLAQCFAASGHAVTVVTPQWRRSWSAQMDLGLVRIVRLRGSARGGWSTIRWMYGLSRWLSQQPLDALLVHGLRHEAYIALGAAAESHLPVIVLADAGDLEWQRSAAFGGRIAARCRTAPAVVAGSPEVASSLLRAGYDEKQLQIIGRRVAIPPLRNPKSQEEARSALVTANHDLLTTANTQVAIAVGRFDAAQRFGDLIRAWRIVTARQPHARLWIIGDGPDREQLYRQIGDLDQRFRVMLPGSFDALDELLQAAHLLIVPAAYQAPPLVLLEAQAAGLPVIAASSPASPQYVAAERTGLTYPVGDFKALATAVGQLLQDPASAIRMGSTAREALQTSPTPTDEAAAYTDLIENLKSKT